jgi:NAD(P)-dependent dehydrogenase (short-subunit alcohol dehydrogenase family)
MMKQQGKDADAPKRAETASGPVPARGGALVTGANRGIGRAIALQLAGLGFDLVVNYRTQQAEAEQVAAQAAASGVRARAVRADVTDPRQARQLVLDAHELTGGLQVLVNNVGDYHHGPLAELTPEVWHRMLDSNLNSTFYTCQAALPLLKQAGWGRIINLGYAGAEQLKARPGIVAYSLAKTGVILYSKALAKTAAGSGVTVNVISPGVLENSETVPLQELPAGRTGTLDELTAAARFLLSAEASYVTGVTIEVAGGWNL